MLINGEKLVTTENFQCKWIIAQNEKLAKQWQNHWSGRWARHLGLKLNVSIWTELNSHALSFCNLKYVDKSSKPWYKISILSIKFKYDDISNRKDNGLVSIQCE